MKHFAHPSSRLLTIEDLSSLKKGQKVKVISSYPSNTNGWSNCWAPPMDFSIGKILTIEDIYRYSGDRGDRHDIWLSNSFGYPIYILELVEE